MTYPVLRMRQGLSPADRESLRQQYREVAIRQADRFSRSHVCWLHNHDRCRAEQPGNDGCLCECHDPKDGLGR